MKVYIDLFGLNAEALSNMKHSTLKNLGAFLDCPGYSYMGKPHLQNFIINYIETTDIDKERLRRFIIMDEDGVVSSIDYELTEKKEMVNEKPIETKSTVAENDSVGAARHYHNPAVRNKVADNPTNFNNEQNSVRHNVEDVKNTAKARRMLEENQARKFAGALEINPKGYGFIRANIIGNDSENDAFVDNMIIRYLGLREGDYIEAVGKRSDEGKSGSVMFVLSVNGVTTDELRIRKNFEALVPIFPDERLKLEKPMGRSDIAIRCIDLIAPIGKGQRALIVSPPKAGKTTLLKSIANSIISNNPEVKVFILLIDERPEEVTDMQRSINAEVIYSTFDESPEHHIQIAESVLKRAKRYVESGTDVCIVLDSITRLARAYNLTVEHSGRALSGGLDPNALSAPKRFFGSARNVEGGGSLTIIATALIETGSRLDDVIFEEFKGTGNMEVVLDRKLSERRIFPAIDLAKSSTRRDDLLLSADELEATSFIRGLLDNNNAEVVDNLLNEIYKSNNNTEFVAKFNERMRVMSRSGYKIRSNKKDLI